MKKVLVVLSVVAFGFAFTSCKKECKCKIGPLNWEIPGDDGAKIETKADCDKVASDWADIGVKCDWK